MKRGLRRNNGIIEDAIPEEQKKYLLIAEDEKPCLICGKMTDIVDFSHARICSDECMDEFNGMATKNELKFTNGSAIVGVDIAKGSTSRGKIKK